MSNSNSFLHTEDDLFYFESDHLALKGNKDYCDTLKSLVILTAQQERALKDLTKVINLKKEALADPVAFWEKIRAKEKLDLPNLMVLPKMPKIDFSKYSVKVSEEDVNAIYNDKTTVIEETDIKQKNHKKWSPEEQKRLEELLMVYPPEPIEMRRFKKIAKALGNRTLKQVTSRVQKYFLKLYKAGLPIPGRIPKSCEKNKKSNLHKHQRNNHYLWKPTTFFPDLCVPVSMDDTDNVPGPSSSSFPQSSTTNYLLASSYQQSTSPTKPARDENELKVELLLRIKEQKLRESDPNYYAFSHTGFECDFCEEKPIVGARWHCTVCMNSVDFCTDCVVSQMLSDNPHSLSHKLAVYQDKEDSQSASDSDSSSSTVTNSIKNLDDDLDSSEDSGNELSDNENGFGNVLMEEKPDLEGNFVQQT